MPFRHVYYCSWSQQSPIFWQLLAVYPLITYCFSTINSCHIFTSHCFSVFTADCSCLASEGQNQYSNSPEWGSQFKLVLNWFSILHLAKNRKLDPLTDLWTGTRPNKNIRSGLEVWGSNQGLGPNLSSPTGLHNGFQQYLRGVSTLEAAHDGVWTLLYDNDSVLFPSGHNGCSVSALATQMFYPVYKVPQLHLQCSHCNHTIVTV